MLNIRRLRVARPPPDSRLRLIRRCRRFVLPRSLPRLAPRAGLRGGAEVGEGLGMEGKAERTEAAREQRMPRP